MVNFLIWACIAALMFSCVQVMRLVQELQRHAQRAEHLHDYCMKRFESLLGERVTEDFDMPSVDANSAEFCRWYARKRSDSFNENKTVVANPYGKPPE